ncbi:hypothetical protein Ccr2_gp279 [Caulobacter phage Ccr2]|nr:hypothetical protein Ccr10_gp280 [Caulobacter phage Ccr10]ARB14155.1 hypothetical protein Ccr2_gp279 [Caulobacter phage Ccr2]ARB14849.1 hypothetical protein Ccr29_gp293 [Caulobacter phage Ccr29]
MTYAAHRDEIKAWNKANPKFWMNYDYLTASGRPAKRPFILNIKIGGAEHHLHFVARYASFAGAQKAAASLEAEVAA